MACVCTALNAATLRPYAFAVTLLARRDGSKMRFALRQGVGEWVDRAPWKIEWGGGASVENPHFQRVHYCELLVSCIKVVPRKTM